MEPNEGSQETGVQKTTAVEMDADVLTKLRLKSEIYDLSVGINQANQRIAQLEAELRKL